MLAQKPQWLASSPLAHPQAYSDKNVFSLLPFFPLRLSTIWGGGGYGAVFPCPYKGGRLRHIAIGTYPL